MLRRPLSVPLCLLNEAGYILMCPLPSRRCNYRCCSRGTPHSRSSAWLCLWISQQSALLTWHPSCRWMFMSFYYFITQPSGSGRGCWRDTRHMFNGIRICTRFNIAHVNRFTTGNVHTYMHRQAFHNYSVILPLQKTDVCPEMLPLVMCRSILAFVLDRPNVCGGGDVLQPLKGFVFYFPFAVQVAEKKKVFLTIC